MFLDQRTTHMPQTVNINAPLAGTYVAGQTAGIRPYGNAAGNIFQYESVGIQKVEWIEIHATSKLNRKISLTAQYYVIDAHNNGEWAPNTMPSDPYNRNADWGRAYWAGDWARNF